VRVYKTRNGRQGAVYVTEGNRCSSFIPSDYDARNHKRIVLYLQRTLGPVEVEVVSCELRVVDGRTFGQGLRHVRDELGGTFDPETKIWTVVLELGDEWRVDVEFGTVAFADEYIEPARRRGGRWVTVDADTAARYGHEFLGREGQRAYVGG